MTEEVVGDIKVKPIIIKLHESSNAKEFGLGNRIHQREFDRAIKLIDLRIDKAELEVSGKHSEKNSRPRFNDTISILGSRGSGKTSFLLSLLKHYKGDDKTPKSELQAEVLDIIDPTLIEEKGHIFLTIISLIEKAVCDKLNLSDCSPNDPNYHQKKEWKDKLRKLADGLPSMDGVGSSLEHSNWQDAEFIMDRGLKSVQSATNLEANFNDLVKFALKVLEKKIFIITLDDIDVDFRKGWPVLETIRKYLTSPQIVVLLSGDLKLYSKAIRKQQWKNFGKALLINEAEALNKISGFNDLVTEMESQYMQKVLKPENRVRLTTLYEKIELYDQKIFLDDTLIDYISVEDFYKEVLCLFGVNNNSQKEAYTSFLLNLPIRTQIQFLSELSELDISNTSNNIEAFLNDLYEKEVDIDLATSLPKMLNVIILKLLIKEQVISDAYQLQPTTTDPSLNGCLIALSFLFSQKVKDNPYLIFDYFIKIGYVQNLFVNLRYADNTDKSGKALLKPSLEGLCYHSGLFQDKVLRDVVGNMISYIESLPNNSINKNGIVNLFASATKEKGSNKESSGRIDYEFGPGGTNMTILKQTLAFIPLSTSEYIEKNTSITTYSIYTLLGTIGELIRRTKLNDFPNALLEVSQWRTYPMISFERGISNLSEEKDFIEIDLGETTGDNSEIKDHFDFWCEEYNKLEQSTSPHLIGKISTRFYYTLNAIKKKKNLGGTFHQIIVSLLNSILVEDVRENYDNYEGLNINNAVKTDTVFINNLKFVLKNENSTNLSFSKWILSCPLFLLYLNKELLTRKEFSEFVFGGNRALVTFFENNTIYDTLEKVYVKESVVLQNQQSSEKIDFSTDYKKIESIIKKLRENGLIYADFEKMALKDFNLNYSKIFSNKVNSDRLKTFKERIKEKGFEW